MTQPGAVPEQHSVTTMQGLRDELALAQERIARLERELASLTAERDTAVAMRDLEERNKIDFIQQLEVAERELAEARERELAEARAQVLDWENREAAICPEDVGFEKLLRVLRAQLAALGWQPITPDNLPRVGDEVLRQRPGSLISPVVDNAVRPNDTTHEDWIALGYTHFRPIHPPTPERKP
jgi:hypothetical protein